MKLSLSLMATIFLSLVLVFPACASPNPSSNTQNYPQELSNKEFAGLIKTLSEEDPRTYTRTNMISNEASYQHIFPGVLRLGSGNGVYIGVAPEQNFTYIAKFRPRLAFIVDIQRKNMLEVLMYKALFEKAETPTKFLQLLFARGYKNISDLLDAPAGIYDAESASAICQVLIENLVEKGIDLSVEDKLKIKEMYFEFAKSGGSIRSDTGPMNPTLRDLVYEKNALGECNNFLISQEDYDYVREMHRKNLIIPLVGNFGGDRTLKYLGKWLDGRNLKISEFYVSSVEFHIHNKSHLWPKWLSNIDSLPWADNAIIIRTIPFIWNHDGNPESRKGYEWMTLVQYAKGYTKTFAKPTEPKDFSKVYINLVNQNPTHVK